MSHTNCLNVICPTCGVYKEKSCIHTGGKEKGKKRDKPHRDREKLSKTKLSSSSRKKVEDVGKDEPKVAKKNPHDKLTADQAAIVKLLLSKIEVFGRHAEFVGPVTVGPIISTYRFFPMKRTKVAHLEAMKQDFAVALGSEESVLVKRMPGESAVGVYIPNKVRTVITFQETLPNVASFMQTKTKDGHLPIPLNFGVDSNGYGYVDDLTQLPHLLIAGSTGSGKSTVEHALVQSMTYALTPKQLELIISDTKTVEFPAFKHLPHLKFPIAQNLFQTMEQLDHCVRLTQKRLDVFAVEGVRNIHQFNAKVPDERKMPYIVIIIDELADLMGPNIERSESKANSDKLGEIVGRSRASGIHVVAATQRTDVKQIKGAIKANFPSRLSLRLPSPADSKTILNTKGAESLMSQGDMLYISSMSPELKRLHAPYTSLEDTRNIIEMIIQKEEMRQEDMGVVKVGTTKTSAIQ